MSHRYDLNKRQWYAIRDDLKKRGLWRYGSSSGTKRVRTGTASAKRSLPDDPGEGPSTDTSLNEPPSKICEYG